MTEKPKTQFPDGTIITTAHGLKEGARVTIGPVRPNWQFYLMPWKWPAIYRYWRWRGTVPTGEYVISKVDSTTFRIEASHD